MKPEGLFYAMKKPINSEKLSNVILHAIKKHVNIMKNYMVILPLSAVSIFVSIPKGADAQIVVSQVLSETVGRVIRAIEPSGCKTRKRRWKISCPNSNSPKYLIGRKSKKTCTVTITMNSGRSNPLSLITNA